MARVVVVGLGPAGADHVLPLARRVLEEASVRFVRTERHPAVTELREQGIEFEALDRCYEAAATIEAAYEAMVDELEAAAFAHGEVVYAVPGSPAVAERTPDLLTARGVEVVRIPGMSFADLAWARLGVDPSQGARVADAHDLATLADASGPLLVAQCDSVVALSNVKLALLDSLEADTPVTVLARLGLPDERIDTTTLEELDRSVEPDHLTAIFVDTKTMRVASELASFYALVEQLRGPGGCPWDAEQTHHSLARHTLEEAYEVVEVIHRLPRDAPGGEAVAEPDDYDALCDELGDLLFQVFIHSALAREAGAFTVADVARSIHEKLVRRHPHVFGDIAVDSAGEVVANWEQLKKDERGAASVVDGIASGLPSLVYSLKVMRKAESLGVPDDALVGSVVSSDLLAHLAALDADRSGTSIEEAVGELLAAVALFARGVGVDAETSLRGWTARLTDRVRDLERAAERAGVDLGDADPDEVLALWTPS